MSCSGWKWRDVRGRAWAHESGAEMRPGPKQRQVWCAGIWEQVFGGVGVPWNLLTVVVGLTVLAMTVTPGRCQQDQGATSECVVYPLPEQSATPAVPFSSEGDVALSLLPKVPGEVLAGVTLTLTTTSTSVALRISKDDPKTLECWRGSLLLRTFRNLPSFASEDLYDWQHLLVSVREKKVVLNGTLDVCPGVEVRGTNPTLKVSSLKSTNVVFECHEGCPLFANDALAFYAHNGRFPDQEVFVKARTKAKGQLQIIECDGGTAKAPVSADRWQILQLRSRERGRSMTLKVGQDYSKVFASDGEKCPVLDFRASTDLTWSIGCDPREIEDTTTMAPTPSPFLNLIKSPSNDQMLRSTDWPSASGRTATSTSPPCKGPPQRNMAAVVSGWMATGVMVVICVGLAAYIYMLKGENDRLRKNGDGGDGWSVSRGEIPLNVPLSLKFARDTPTPPGFVQTPKHTPKREQQNGGAPSAQDDLIVVHPMSAKSAFEERELGQ